jgi:ABC-2 type transport system permease protein
MPLLWKLRAFLLRDLAADLSYKISFLLEAVHVLIAVAAFFFFSQLVGDSGTQGYASFPFLLIGLTLNASMTTCFVCFAQAISGGRQAGTLKSTLAMPISPAEFLICSSAYPFLRATIDAVVYSIAGWLFGFSSQINLVTAAAVFAMSLLAFSCVGIVSASVTLVFKRGDPVLWLFGSASCLLGGVLFPTDLLPDGLRQIGALLPITHAVNGMRAAVLTGASPLAIWPDMRALAVFALFGFPASLLAFEMAVRHVKYAGALDHN